MPQKKQTPQTKSEIIHLVETGGTADDDVYAGQGRVFFTEAEQP